MKECLFIFEIFENDIKDYLLQNSFFIIFYLIRHSILKPQAINNYIYLLDKIIKETFFLKKKLY